MAIYISIHIYNVWVRTVKLSRPPHSVPRSERESQRALHHPRSPRRSDGSEERIRLIPSGVEPGGRVEPGVLGVVEGVISFPAKRQVAFFAGDRKILGKREIPVVHARVADIVLAGI